MKDSSRVVGVGIFVVVGLALFTVGLFMIGDRRLLFQDRFEIYTEFARLAGLQNGATVRVAGMDAGEVLQIEFPGGPEAKFRVRMRVREDLHPLVRSDSVALIQTEGLLGNQILEVSAGSQAAPPAPALSTIPSREPFEFADVMERLSDTAKKVDAGVEELRADLGDAFDRLRRTARNVDERFELIGRDLKAITESGTEIAENINTIVDNAKAGKGTVGKLLTDDAFYDEAKTFAREAGQATTNLREASDHAKRMLKDLQQSDIVPEAERTVRNLRQLSDRIRQAVEEMRTADEQEGLMVELRQTIGEAREAMSDLADDTEAMKRNFLLRGFFKKRGFYDLDSLTYQEYTTGKLATKHLQQRVWLHQSELFTTDKNGAEKLSEQGKQRLDQVMADFLRYPRNSPLMVEGYAGEGALDQQYLRSRERAALAKRYLVLRFHLDAGYVGAMPMGAVKANTPNGEYWEGVSLVLFFKKTDQPTASFSPTR